MPKIYPYVQNVQDEENRHFPVPEGRSDRQAAEHRPRLGEESERVPTQRTGGAKVYPAPVEEPRVSLSGLTLTPEIAQTVMKAAARTAERTASPVLEADAPTLRLDAEPLRRRPPALRRNGRAGRILLWAWLLPAIALAAVAAVLVNRTAHRRQEDRPPRPVMVASAPSTATPPAPPKFAAGVGPEVLPISPENKARSSVVHRAAAAGSAAVTVTPIPQQQQRHRLPGRFHRLHSAASQEAEKTPVAATVPPIRPVRRHTSALARRVASPANPDEAPRRQPVPRKAEPLSSRPASRENEAENWIDQLPDSP